MWRASVVLFCFLLSVSCVFAEKTVKTIEIPLSFVPSAAANANYTQNITVSLPDRIDQILSVEFKLRGDFVASGGTTVYGRVGRNASSLAVCSPSSVVTPVLNGYDLSFDCTSLVQGMNFKNGTFVAGFQANKLAANIKPRMVMTYLNNPVGSISVSGTEYVAGDPGTVFVQLLDGSGGPVLNGSCYVDIYYPLSGGIHPYVLQDTPMVPALNGDDGFYFYDLTIPSTLGVYMVSAKCSYAYDWRWIYPVDEVVYSPVRQAQTGTWAGATLVLNNPQDSVYDSCQTTAACVANYTFNVSQYGNLTNVTNINLYYLGEATKATTLTFYYWNGTSMVALSNTLALVATGSVTSPSGVDQMQTNAVPVSAILNGTVKIQISENQGTTHALFNNWLSLAVLTAYSVVIDVKGNSEMHVSGSSDTSDDRFYSVTSCDGYSDGRCARFTNDGEFNLTEGELEDFLNITAVGSKNDAMIHVHTPLGVDCVALYWIKRDVNNGTNWTVFSDYIVYSRPEFGDCEIVLNENLTGGQDYKYWFKMDNFMKWEVDWSKKQSDAVNVTIARVCDGLNFTYVIPIVENTTLSDDTMIQYCHQAKDDQYWINTYYDESQSVSVAGDYAAYVQEMEFYRPSLQARYEWLVQEGSVLPGLSGINATVVQIDTTVNTTKSLVQQIWSWVQSIFGWVQTDNDANASTAIATNIPASIVPQSVAFVSSQYYEQQSSAVLVQVQRDGLPLSGSSCTLNVFYPNMTAFLSGVSMSYSGSGGLYNYTWTPQVYGSYPAQVNCSGGTLSGQVSAVSSLGVSSPSSGVVMQMVS